VYPVLHRHDGADRPDLPPFLALLSTPDDIMDRATIYIRIIFLGIPLSILYNMVSGIIRALGDSKTPLYFLVFSSVLNIFLDLLFILVFHWDGAGVRPMPRSFPKESPDSPACGT
jgi:Na+-driven multidrug efflux pump